MIKASRQLRTQTARRAALQSPAPHVDTPHTQSAQPPDATATSPALAQRSLQSILQRASQLTADSLNAQPHTEAGQGVNSGAPAQSAVDYYSAPAFSTIQRKTSKLITADVLEAQKSIIFKDSYDALISFIEAYFDDTNAPEHNYGRRLRYIAEIGKDIGKWEAKHGPAEQPVTSFFKSTADKRRPLIKQLKDSLALEETQVQDDGLAQAKAAHKIDRDKLTEYLNEGASSTERMLKNTCEWFKLGKAKLYAVTPTGDSEARIAKAKMNVNRDEAWFPRGLKGSAGDILDAEVKYNERSVTDNTNVNLDQDGKVTGGWNVPGVVVITNPAKASKETVWETLRHEVQHDADFNKGRDAGAATHTAGAAFDATGATLKVNAAKTAYEVAGTTGQKTAGESARKTYEAEVALTRYKTEYRAYSYQEGETSGPYAKLDNTTRDKLHDGKLFTERQLQIFKHIYKGYDYTKSNWDADTPLTGGRTFRDEVVNYWNPDTEAFNKFNSPRVDDFYRALDVIGTKAPQTLLATKGGKDVAPVAVGGQVEDVTDAGVVKLLAAVNDLNGEDADYIFNDSQAMIKKIKAHLKGAALAKVLEDLKDMADFSKLASISLFD